MASGTACAWADHALAFGDKCQTGAARGGVSYVSSFQRGGVSRERVCVDAMRMAYGSRKQVIVLDDGA